VGYSFVTAHLKDETEHRSYSEKAIPHLKDETEHRSYSKKAIPHTSRMKQNTDPTVRKLYPTPSLRCGV
jgi:hypothetical protein